MPSQPRTFSISDPATFDGNPFEVAERAIRQVGAVAAILAETLQSANNMVANAEMERQIYADGKADYKAYEAGPQAKAIAGMIETASAIEQKCSLLARAAAFDPKHPPKE